MSADVIVCGPGCCPGCQDCYGMQIGCHQEPCRCDQPCSCDWSQADESAHWQDGCIRHNSEDDTRGQESDDGPEDYGLCPVCGEGERCAEDDEGRPLFHSGAQS